MNDHFWYNRIQTNRDVTIPIAFGHCEKTGRINNFKIAGGLMEGKFQSSILKSDYNRVVIYLNDSIMDLSKPVTVEYNGNTIFHGKIKRTSQVIANSISLFQDPCYIYSAKVEVTK